MADAAFVGIGNVRRVLPLPNGMEFLCRHGRVRVTVMTSTIVRVQATRRQQFGPDLSYAVVPQPGAPWSRRSSRSQVELRTGSLVVRIRQSPLRIEFRTADGRRLNRDEPRRGMGWEGEKCRSYREIQPAEKFFGCGEKSGMLNKRGQSFGFWNTDNPTHTYANGELYVSIPFLVATRPGAHYGIFWDNTHRTDFNLGQVADEQHYWLQSAAGEIDYYFIAGNSVREIVRGYTGLTGRMKLPPRWALGYQQCRWSYMTAAEMLAVARQFRRRRIPCDVLYCDIDYMEGYRVWTWNRKRFPQPRRFIRQLRDRGFNLVTIIDPGVKHDNRYAVCRDGKRRGVFVKRADGKIYVGKVWPGPSVFPDFTNPRVRVWWGEWQREFVDLGVAGYWNDMNEPSVFDGPGNTMPVDNRHDWEGQGASHARAHNVYGLTMARACHEGLRRWQPDRRPFVITRSAYAGIQRYSMVWTGDNQSLWEQFAASIPQCLNLGLSGVAFCGPDVGGFGRDCTGELLARWTQAGAFFPFFRNHTSWQTRPQEPWAFGPAIERICRRYIRLRYQLLPYLYNLFREAATDGTPIMRPLFWEFPADNVGYAVDDQFLLGPALLVAPVVKPAATARAVYLPAGSEWYDYWTKRKQRGGQWVGVAAPLETMPLFVRAGTILPTIPAMDYVSQRPAPPITLDIYPGRPTTGYLYEDDGDTFAYERGGSSLTRFTWTGRKLQVTGDRAATRRFRVVVR